MPVLFDKNSSVSDQLQGKSASLDSESDMPIQPEPDEANSPEEKVVDNTDLQTQFSEDIVIDPPAKKLVKKSLPQEPASAPSPLKRFAPVLVGLGIAAVAVVAMAVLVQDGPVSQDNPIITIPTTQQQTELNQLQRELTVLEKDVEEADPLQAKLAFPPVSFDLELEDATVLQQAQQARQRTPGR